MKRNVIKRRIKFWQNQLGLDNWSIEVFFDLKHKSKSEKGNFTTAAHTDAHCQYKLGSISFNPKMLHAVTDGVIIHELLHCLMSPMGGYTFKSKDQQEGFMYYNEMVTSEIERIILRMYGKRGSKKTS